jgi:hypothetical protein
MSYMSQILFATTRLEIETPDHLRFGTAFIFDYKEGSNQYFFLVTNKHIVKDGVCGSFILTASDGEKPLGGTGHKFNIGASSDFWFGHPNADVDIAVMPMGPLLHQAHGEKTPPPFFKAISQAMIPSAEEFAGFDVYESLVFVGYPDGLFDQVNLMPIMRQAMTATALQLDYEGIPGFLISASVFPGSSGSPVLICDQGAYSVKGGLVLGSRIHFMGVVSRWYFREDERKVEIADAARLQQQVVRTREALDLGFVWRGETVVEAIKHAISTTATPPDEVTVTSA